MKECEWDHADTKHQRQLCWAARCCHCKNRGDKGKFLKRVYRNVQAAIKARCPDKEAEQNLKSGMFVLQWSGLPAQDADPEDQEAYHVFTHVCETSLSPWRLTLATLVVDDMDRDKVIVTPGIAAANQVLKMNVEHNESGSVPIFSLWEFLEMFEFETLDLKMMLSVWTLSMRPRPVASVTSSLYVVPLAVVPSEVWSGIVSERKPRRRRTKPLAEIWADDEEEAAKRPCLEGDSENEDAEAEDWGDMQESDEDQGEDILSEALKSIAVAASSAEEPQSSEVVHNGAVICLPSLADLERPPQWGCFRFSRKQARSNLPFGGYEVTCPYHRLNHTTKCKKFIRLFSREEAELRRALNVARYWASEARSFELQATHVRGVNLAEGAVPPPEEVERRVIHDVPLLVRTDAEILADAAPRELAVRKGRGRGRGAGAAAPAQAKAKGKAKAKARVQAGQGELPSVDDQEHGASARSSSSSGSTSTSSSSS